MRWLVRPASDAVLKKLNVEGTVKAMAAKIKWEGITAHRATMVNFDEIAHYSVNVIPYTEKTHKTVGMTAREFEGWKRWHVQYCLQFPYSIIYRDEAGFFAGVSLASPLVRNLPVRRPKFDNEHARAYVGFRDFIVSEFWKAVPNITKVYTMESTFIMPKYHGNNLIYDSICRLDFEKLKADGFQGLMGTSLSERTAKACWAFGARKVVEAPMNLYQLPSGRVLRHNFGGSQESAFCFFREFD